MFSPNFDPDDSRHTELILNIVEKFEKQNQPPRTLDVGDYGLGDPFTVGSRVLLPYTKYTIFSRRRRYKEALAELQEIIASGTNEPLFFGLAIPEAVFYSAEIYKRHFNNEQKALEQYYFIITNYPDQYDKGGEWNSWIDDDAAKAILEMFANDPQRLYEESGRIISVSRSTAVKLTGYAGKVKSLGLQGKYREMVDTAYAAIRKFPDLERYFYKTPVNYTVTVASTAFTLLLENGKTETFYNTAKQIKQEFQNKTVGGFAALVTCTASMSLCDSNSQTDGPIFSPKMN